MSESAELLTLRLALIGAIFLFVLVTAITLRSGLQAPVAAPVARAGAVRRAGARLVVVAPGETGLEPGIEFSLAGQMTLGRDAGNSIILGDSSVSGQHARIERTRDAWRVIDLASTNGTFIDGRPVDGRGASLRGGEQIALGAVALRFVP